MITLTTKYGGFVLSVDGALITVTVPVRNRPKVAAAATVRQDVADGELTALINTLIQRYKSNTLPTARSWETVDDLKRALD